MVSLETTWASHREIHLLVVPVSPISSAVFEGCWTNVQEICSSIIPLKSLNPPRSWRNRANGDRGDSAFEHFSWTSGTVSCMAVRSTMTSKDRLSPWVEQESHRRVRAVIGFQACDCDNIFFDAKDIAIKFAIKEHNADLNYISSAGIYIDSNNIPYILNNDTLQSTTYDAIIKLVVVNACLALHADASALAVERLILPPRRDTLFSASNFSRNVFTSTITPPGLPSPSILDNHLMMPKLPKKQQKARQLKRLADLALLTGSCLDPNTQHVQVPS